MTKVLICDDSSFMRKILKNILAKIDTIEIVEAENGEAGLEKYKSEKPDLVLLDIIMEKKDGVEVLKEIKAANKDAKVIMISAVGQEQMVKEALELGADDFIVKPFDSAKVEESVKKALA